MDLRPLVAKPARHSSALWWHLSRRRRLKQAARGCRRHPPSTTPSQEPSAPPVAASVASMPAAERVSTTSLPGFDLHVVGEPAERLAVMKYAEQAGLSPEVLAQLFPATDQALVDPSVEGRSLADAVATAIAAWLATNQTQSAATGEASSLVPGSMGPAQISSEMDPARLLEIDLESVNQLIAPMLAQATAEGDVEGCRDADYSRLAGTHLVATRR